jgi:type I restriction enzyme S subunit
MIGWIETELKNLVDSIVDNRGKTPPTLDVGYELLEVNTVSADRRTPDYSKVRKFVSEETYQNWFRKGHPLPGDILVPTVGTIGNVALVQQSRGAIAQNLIALRLKDNVNSTFVYYFLSSPIGRDMMISFDIGGVQPSIKVPHLLDMKVSAPSLPEQKAIANVLSSLDDKIDLLHRQNKTLESMAETLFRQWFIEDAQEDWEDGALGDEFEFTMGQSPSGSSFNEDGVGIPMFQGNADFSFRFPSERVFTTEPTRFAQKYDTLISVRAPVGAQNMANKECCIGRGLAAFRFKHNNQFYTYTYFKLRSLMDSIKQFNDEGTVFGSISKSDFEQLPINIPTIDFIERFEETARPINNKVITNCSQIKSLEKLRDTLLPKLMSGEVRVKI